MPCTVRLIKPFTLRDSTLLPEGSVGQMDDNCVVIFPTDTTECRVRLNPYRLYATIEVVGRGGEGVPVEEPPDRADLHRIVLDSMCPSITGYDVEPDGHDPDGAPSWLLALGLI